jgi:ATP-dependent RNA helicase DDX35
MNIIIYEKVFQEDKLDLDTHKETAYVYNPVQSWSLNAQRARLPIAKNKDDILYLLEKNQVLVVVGDTGCGKSTQIPQYLADAGWCEVKNKVFI